MEAVIGLQHAAADQPSSQSLSVTTDEPFAQPSNLDASAFATAIANSHVSEVSAVRAPSASALSDGIAHQMGKLESRVKTFSLDHGSQVSPDEQNDPVKDNKTMISEALAQMDHAFAFSVETTLASHGSTEATRNFNELLKGQ